LNKLCGKKKKKTVRGEGLTATTHGGRLFPGSCSFKQLRKVTKIGVV